MSNYKNAGLGQDNQNKDNQDKTHQKGQEQHKRDYQETKRKVKNPSYSDEWLY